MSEEGSTDLYVVDTNTINEWEDYYPDRFPSFWENLEDLVDDGRLTSTRLVKDELENWSIAGHVLDWADDHETLFLPPTKDEMEFVTVIFEEEHFQQLISERKRKTYHPIADPWLIARAAVNDGCVVTEERRKPNAAKIPNVCEHFEIDWCDLEEMLKREDWIF